MSDLLLALGCIGRGAIFAVLCVWGLVRWRRDESRSGAFSQAVGGSLSVLSEMVEPAAEVARVERESREQADEETAGE